MMRWGLLLLALPAWADGFGPYVLGNDDGVYRPNVVDSASTVTIDAMPYARTVSCGSYTVTGDYTGALPSWTASPSGASGACTDEGGGTFECVVDVDPDATGEGVETITIGDQTVTIGFYVAGSHSCFLAQSVNGAYNVGLANADPVATWVNLGSSGLNVTQGTGSAQPTYRTNCFGSLSPCVRFDAGDLLRAALASDWTFLSNGSDASAHVAAKTELADPNTLYTILATSNSANTPGSRGYVLWYDDRAASNFESTVNTSVASGSVLNFTVRSGRDFPSQTWIVYQSVVDDDAGAGADVFQKSRGGDVGQQVSAGSYSASAPLGPLTIADLTTNSAFKWRGDIQDILIYSSALTETQQGINRAVARWASGDTVPSYSDTWLAVGDSITAGTGGVTNWPTRILTDAPSTVWISNRGVSSNNAAACSAQWTASSQARNAKVFVLCGINDTINGADGTTTYNTLATIYSSAQSAGSEVIAMTTPPAGNYVSWSAGDQVEIVEMNDAILLSSADIIVDLYELMGEPGTPEDLAASYDIGDGLHLSAAGAQFVSDTVATALGL